MDNQLLMNLRGVTPEEYHYLEQIMKGMDDQQARTFIMYYGGKRKNPQDMLLFTLLGFVGIAGVQRFVTEQIGMGLLYFFTAGLCFIGTIVDLINHKNLAEEYNQKVAREWSQIVRSAGPTNTPNPGL